MIKKNLKILVITSLLILLPVAAGVILWNQLPVQIPTHWNMAGEVDGWSSKGFAVFGLPLILLAVQWICLLGTSADPKKAHHSEKVLHLVFWIVPVLAIVLSTVMYAVALGKTVKVDVILMVLLGLVFVIIGNYLPKCRQNYTIGIKLPWTLHSEENWNRTHRLAGRIWVVCGLVVLLGGFFGQAWIILAAGLVMVLVPTVYSYLLFRKGV